MFKKLRTFIITTVVLTSLAFSATSCSLSQDVSANNQRLKDLAELNAKNTAHLYVKTKYGIDADALDYGFVTEESKFAVKYTEECVVKMGYKNKTFYVLLDVEKAQLKEDTMTYCADNYELDRWQSTISDALKSYTHRDPIDCSISYGRTEQITLQSTDAVETASCMTTRSYRKESIPAMLSDHGGEEGGAVKAFYRDSDFLRAVNLPPVSEKEHLELINLTDPADPADYTDAERAFALRESLLINQDGKEYRKYFQTEFDGIPAACSVTVNDDQKTPETAMDAVSLSDASITVPKGYAPETGLIWSERAVKAYINVKNVSGCKILRFVKGADGYTFDKVLDVKGEVQCIDFVDGDTLYGYIVAKKA